MAIEWKKIRKTQDVEGTKITYAGDGTPLQIVSWKREIPHANEEGTWEFTSYLVMLGKTQLKEKYTLAGAKIWAEDWTKIYNEVEENTAQTRLPV